jgi:regulatory protein
MLRPRRPPKPVTAERLHRIALHYLERYASSAANLRRVLMRRVDRAARAGISDREEGTALVAKEVERCRASKLVDDAVYAEGRVQSLHRKGKPRSAIKRALAAKGVGAEEIEQAIGGLTRDEANPDLAAAFTLARRRRLGPFRLDAREENRQRDMAVLGRAGFSFEIARKIVEAEDIAAIEAELAARAG